MHCAFCDIAQPRRKNGFPRRSAPVLRLRDRQGTRALTTAPMIETEGVRCVFGARDREALAMLRAGESRAATMERTGPVVALNDVALRVDEGELLVVMCLSVSG